MNNTVLIIDDEQDIRNLLARTLEYEGYDVLVAEKGTVGLQKLKHYRIHVIFCDIKLPDTHGVELTTKIKKISPETEVICFTAFGNIQDGIQAMKNGAFDYLVKGDDNPKIIPLVQRATEKARLQFQLTDLREKISKRHGFERIVGKSPLVAEAVSLAKKVAQSDLTVLLTGPTGTGKEVFAQAIHHCSARKNQSFVAVNCSAFGKELLESELFGHKAGAFTGATRDKKGLFEEAHKGTIFLDEIGEMDLNLQAKLLRVLESGTFIKVGDTKESKVDVRIIAATNRILEQEIEKEHFREDLYYRLATFQIKLPSLNDRKEDIPVLVEQFITEFGLKAGKKIKGISKDYLEALKKHVWKGNIRELRNVVERSVILCEGATLTGEDLPFDFNLHNSPVNSGVFDLKQLEKSHIKRVLDHTKGNKTKAAALLGIGLTTLYRKLEEYHIHL